MVNMARNPTLTKAKEPEATLADKRHITASAIRAFLAFVETFDRDAEGNHICAEDNLAIQHLWGQLCETINEHRRLLLARAPIEDGVRRRDLMSASDSEEFRTLSNALFESALTRYTPEGERWIDAVARSAHVPPVGRIIVEADRIRKLRTIAGLMDPAVPALAVVDDDEAKPPALAGGVALTADHKVILTVVGRNCMTVTEVSGVGPIRCRETAGRLLRELESFGMVYRPYGKRKGYALAEEIRKRLTGATPT
jgi:hypothetical protein